jgi:threonine-phosphate decarboxylase
MGVSPKVLRSIRQHASLVRHYPDPNTELLVEKLSEYVNVNTNNLIVSNGSTELIHLFADVFLSHGHEALIPVPTFGEYKTATLKVGAKPVLLACDSADSFDLNFAKLAESVSKNTRMIFLCNPNSPTAKLYSEGDVLRVVRLAAERNVLVFVDEAYFEFVDDDKRFSMAKHAERHSNLFVLRSLTKFFGLAGLRVGFGIASPTIVEALKKAQVPWSVNTLAMFAAVEAIEDNDFVKKSRLMVNRNKRKMEEMLRRISWLKVYPSDANFFLIEINRSDLTSTQLKEALERKRLLIRDCSNFDGLSNRFFRVAVSKHSNNKRLVECLKSFN